MLSLLFALQNLRPQVTHRLRREDGAVTIEYGIIVVIIAVGLITAGIAFRGAIIDWFAEIATCFPIGPDATGADC